MEVDDEEGEGEDDQSVADSAAGQEDAGTVIELTDDEQSDARPAVMRTPKTAT